MTKYAAYSPKIFKDIQVSRDTTRGKAQCKVECLYQAVNTSREIKATDIGSPTLWRNEHHFSFQPLISQDTISKQ